MSKFDHTSSLAPEGIMANDWLRIIRNVRNMRKGRIRNVRNWVLVMEIYGCGSTMAHDICAFCDIDPDALTA